VQVPRGLQGEAVDVGEQASGLLLEGLGGGELQGKFSLDGGLTDLIEGVEDRLRSVELREELACPRVRTG
jgi:hypothetical protein